MNAFRLGLLGLYRSAPPLSRRVASARPLFQPICQNRYASYQRFPGRRGTQFSSEGPAEKLKFFWFNYRPIILGTGTAGTVFYVYNLEEVPITGRKRFNCLSPATEKQILGDAGYQDLLREYQGRILPENHPYTRMVTKVVERLLPAVGNLGIETEWAVHVIDEPNEKNAFVVPGGKVFVFSGIIPICQDENGVATVLGHEIAHNVAHHTAERISRSLFVFLISLAATALFDVSGTTSKYITDLVLSLPNGRTQEAEADHIGLLLMARSCFDPKAAIGFWHRMAQAEKYAPPQFLSTHPSSHNREGWIRGWLPEASTIYDSSECGSTSAWAKDFKVAFEGPKVTGGRPPLGGRSPTDTKPRRDDEDDGWPPITDSQLICLQKHELMQLHVASGTPLRLLSQILLRSHLHSGYIDLSVRVSPPLFNKLPTRVRDTSSMMSHQTQFHGVAVITGAGSGIGAAVALAFAAAGCTSLALCDINNKGLESTLENLRKNWAKAQSTRFEAFNCDVSNPSVVSNVFSKIVEVFGRIDYAVNCAGITTNNKPSTECSIEEFDRINAVNMRGVWLSSREELKIMKTQPLNLGNNNEIPEYRAQRGAIVNIASGSAIVAVPNSPAYAAAKAGVVSLTRADALDYSPHRIRVNAILPGLVDTPMMDQVPGQRDMVIQMALPMVPMRRLLMAEEIADAALFLCSWKASSVQGSSMVVDGGYTII